MTRPGALPELSGLLRCKGEGKFAILAEGELERGYLLALWPRLRLLVFTHGFHRAWKAIAKFFFARQRQQQIRGLDAGAVPLRGFVARQLQDPAGILQSG